MKNGNITRTIRISHKPPRRFSKSSLQYLKRLTDYIRPEDDPFVEHYQTPAILEIIREVDSEFKTSLDKFIEAIGKPKH